LLKQQVNETASWWNSKFMKGKLMNWQAYKTVNWRIGKFIKWQVGEWHTNENQVDEITSGEREVYKTASCWNSSLMKQQFD